LNVFFILFRFFLIRSLYLRVKVRKEILLSVLASVLASPTAKAIAPNPSPAPYQQIPQRNVFGLRPAPFTPVPQSTPAAPPKLTLQGITTILGNKLAILKALVPAIKPGDQAKEQALLLAEGQRDGNIEVLQVDEKAGSVTVNDFGTVTTLTFAKNGAPLPSAPAPGASAPGSLPNPNPASVPPVSPVAPVTNPAALYTPPANLTDGLRSLPLRIPRSPATGTTAPSVQTSPAPAPLSSTPPTAQPQAPAQAGQVTPEEQLILNAVERQLNQNITNTTPPPPNPAPLPNPPGTLVPGSSPPTLVPQ
jgi:hypothetical protein